MYIVVKPNFQDHRYVYVGFSYSGLVCLLQASCVLFSFYISYLPFMDFLKKKEQWSIYSDIISFAIGRFMQV